MNYADLMFCLNKAHLGEIYLNIRSIVFKNYEEENTIILRYYLYTLPTQFDLDQLQLVSQKLTKLVYPEVLTIHTECAYSTAPLHLLDPLTAIVFEREVDKIQDPKRGIFVVHSEEN